MAQFEVPFPPKKRKEKNVCCRMYSIGLYEYMESVKYGKLFIIVFLTIPGWRAIKLFLSWFVLWHSLKFLLLQIYLQLIFRLTIITHLMHGFCNIFFPFKMMNVSTCF